MSITENSPAIQTGRKALLARGSSLSLLFLAAAFICFPLGITSEASRTLSLVFVGIVLEAIPFMLIGAVVGGLIEVFVSRERLSSLLPQRGWQTVCVAAAAGLVFPVCECAVVPVVRRLLGKGLPLAAAIAYLLGGPLVNPIVTASTALAYAFDWRMVLLRLGLGYAIAVGIGLLMGALFRRSPACILQPQSPPAGNSSPAAFLPMAPPATGDDISCACSHHRTGDSRLSSRLIAALAHAMDDFLAVGHYLVIGAFIAALAQTFINRSAFLDLAASPLLAILAMMLLAILLNLCSEADAFIAASFRGLMPHSAQLAFLLVGPMFDLKLLLMYQSLFRRRAIVVLALLICLIICALTFGGHLLDIFP